jgi:hypothetical protein
VTGIEVDATRPSACQLLLRYVVTGKVRDLRIPPKTAPNRADELWHHTCFEAFVRASVGAAYYELNFSPSMQWAAYRFDSYRSGMIVVHELSAPRLAVRANGESLVVQASMELDRLSGLPSDAMWLLGLSAVIEEKTGNKSYWALAHPPGKADFHHADCFALELPAA